VRKGVVPDRSDDAFGVGTARTEFTRTEFSSAFLPLEYPGPPARVFKNDAYPTVADFP
jgi:hypothetical protein